MFGILLPSSFTRVVRSTPYTVWGERGGQEGGSWRVRRRVRGRGGRRRKEDRKSSG